MVTAAQLDKLKAGAENIGQVAVGAAEKLSAEAINLFIVQSALNVLKFLSVFIIFYMVKKYLDFLQSAGWNEKKVRALNLSALIIAITFFVTQSFPHLMEISKALIAPNIFLLEKGKEFYKDVKGVGKIEENQSTYVKYIVSNDGKTLRVN